MADPEVKYFKNFTPLQKMYSQCPALPLSLEFVLLKSNCIRTIGGQNGFCRWCAVFLLFFFPTLSCLNGPFHSSNITVPFPLYYLIPLIPLSALDVGEATAPAIPPTSLHYSLHTFILLLDVTHPPPPPFMSLYATCFKMGARLFMS